MAGESIASSRIADNPIGSAGVCMVKSVPILDTSDMEQKIVSENYYSDALHIGLVR
jgi:hypothetical protein